MQRPSFPLLLLLPLFLSACSSEAPDRSTNDVTGVKADTVFTNGKVYTVNEDQPWVEAVAIRDNKIVFVGSNEKAEGYIGEKTTITDLDGKMMMPGFISAHDHLVASRWINYGVQLYSAKTKEEYYKRIREYADANPDEKVVLGIGWNADVFGGFPLASELDAIISDRPAIILDFTNHDGWLNTKAMELGGITKDTEDATPGVTYWTRDKEGNPIGAAIEFAWMPAYVKCGAWDPEKLITASQKELFQAAVEAGMTSYLNPAVVTPNATNMDGMFEDYAFVMNLLTKLNEAGKLQMRSFIQPVYKNPKDDPKEFAKRAAAFSKKYHSDMVNSFGVKVHAEGNWSSRTSLLLEPYLNEDGTPSDSYGASGVSPELLKELVLAVNAEGLDAVAHVDGDATVRGMIDAIEASIKAGNSDTRNQLHHLHITHPDDLKRILEMKLLVNVTPIFTTDWQDANKTAYAMLGEKRTNEEYGVYPIVVRNGNYVSFSADLPSAPKEVLPPLLNLETAMTLQDPFDPDSKPFPPSRNGVSLEDGIKGITISPTYQIRMEDKIGTIEVGKYADLVILEQNLFEVAPRDIADVKVLATILNGEYTYKSK
jgi:predicted amidohydrolase YtcJ